MRGEAVAARRTGDFPFNHSRRIQAPSGYGPADRYLGRATPCTPPSSIGTASVSRPLPPSVPNRIPAMLCAHSELRLTGIPQARPVMVAAHPDML